MTDSLYTEVEQVLGPGSTWIAAPPPSTSPFASSSNSTASNSPVLFHAFRRTFTGAAKHDSYVWLEILSPDLLKSLKAIFPTLATLYETVAGVDARAVYVQHEALRSKASSPAVDSLLRYVEGSFAYRGNHRDLPAEIGQDIETVHEMAVTLDSWAYVQEAMGRALVLSCHFYQWAGTCWHRIPLTRKIREFGSLQEISALPARPLTKEKQASLRGTTSWIEAGRHIGQHTRAAERNLVRPPVTEDQLHLLPPSIHGFSLRAKRFGEFLISRLSPVVWRNESFSHLVIPASYRRIVKALVTVHAGALKEKLMVDVVEGKGNGLVMAFHGAPGTGKTLTAEAVAEHLRRPLYVVSAGELGTTAQTLENQLKNVLELATAWNAVLLIDEADIFLTKRDTRQLERNALVGIFLRLLEYFTRVLILTTNHIENFDEAFLSRFAVVLRFDELDEPSRRTLWERRPPPPPPPPPPVPPHSLSAFDLTHLASFRLNGRDIKHVVQTAQAVALVEGEELEMEHLDEVLRVAKSGVRRE
ncbi:hypothetical protein JCM10296v2_004801 [Rhodotorula toruloides]